MKRNNENWKHPELIAILDDDVENRYQKMVDYCMGTPCESAAKEYLQLITDHGHKKADTVPGGASERMNTVSGLITYFAYYGEMPNPE